MDVGGNGVGVLMLDLGWEEGWSTRHNIPLSIYLYISLSSLYMSHYLSLSILTARSLSIFLSLYLRVSLG